MPIAFDEYDEEDPIPAPNPPALRVGALSALPAGTLAAGYSQLLVAEGCLGGPWYVDKLDDQVCGDGYSGRSTLAQSFVVLSRETSINIGFQALHASRATCGRPACASSSSR